MREYVGTLDHWFETGQEGEVWILSEDGKQGYEGMVIIQPKDYLIVYNADGTVLFHGTIVFDHKTGRKRIPGSKHKRYQQAALGRWIHWIQKGWKPDDWAKLFVRKEGEKLRARLIR